MKWCGIFAKDSEWCWCAEADGGGTFSGHYGTFEEYCAMVEVNLAAFYTVVSVTEEEL